MESKWLEDFVSLAETRSFSKSAELRHVTQPAFSRRIRALESWLGGDLVDRTVFPTRLTPAGERFLTHAIALLAAVHNARAEVRGESPLPQDTVRFALPHTLALTFFPRWLAGVEAGFGAVSSRLTATNVHDAVMALVEGHCDLLICYHHARQPVQLDPARYEMLVLGSERLRPYAAPAQRGVARFALPGRAGTPLPYLAYSPNAYLARMADLVLEAAPRRAQLKKVYETDMAEGLKVMALEGHGVAFLPESAVTREVAQGLLCAAGDENWTVVMEIRMYRERRAGAGFVDRLWRHVRDAAPGRHAQSA
ncbi:MAG: LysR family transcriptional regulator [Burkholderiales bacterium]|nr:LysR family transcriptional regulator [Burkholderiales bacterium]